MKAPICCNRKMFASGGITSGRKDIRHDWKCMICGKEVIDILEYKEIKPKKLK